MDIEIEGSRLGLEPKVYYAQFVEGLFKEIDERSCGYLRLKDMPLPLYGVWRQLVDSTSKQLRRKYSNQVSKKSKKKPSTSTKFSTRRSKKDKKKKVARVEENEEDDFGEYEEGWLPGDDVFEVDHDEIELPQTSHRALTQSGVINMRNDILEAGIYGFRY